MAFEHTEPWAKELYRAAGPGDTAFMAKSSVFLVVTSDGKMLKGEREVKDLPREELVKLVGDLVDLMMRR